MENICAIRNLTKVFFVERTGEYVHALDRIDLDLNRSEFLILLGPSGCGKSTLLFMLSGLDHPTSGEITFTEKSHDNKRLTCTVFQEYALFPWRTVIDNVAFGPEMRRVRKRARYREAERYIELVNLTGFETRFPNELSGGMRQRVALARALANDPEVILFDEPLAALDAQTRRVLQTELVSIWSKTKKTFVYVTHSLEEAVLLGERIVLMSSRPGRVKEIIDIADIPRPRSTTNEREVKVLAMLAEHIAAEVDKSMRREREL
ncbi:MAG: ABC transporter ATP-binding protein [Candidatus Tectomicrobia bacterium]|nr:ABC transporter ATP-binding protein [Candidatus Tectomicrobia bacterium]